MLLALSLQLHLTRRSKCKKKGKKCISLWTIVKTDNECSNNPPEICTLLFARLFLLALDISNLLCHSLFSAHLALFDQLRRTVRRSPKFAPIIFGISEIYSVFLREFILSSHIYETNGETKHRSIVCDMWQKAVQSGLRFFHHGASERAALSTLHRAFNYFAIISQSSIWTAR